MFSFSKERVINGYLPLPHNSARLLALVTWIPAVAIVAGALVAAAGSATMALFPASPPGAILLFFGLILMLGGGLEILVTRPLIGPQGKVIDTGSVVELSRVSPAFVSAIRDMSDPKSGV